MRVGEQGLVGRGKYRKGWGGGTGGGGKGEVQKGMGLGNRKWGEGGGTERDGWCGENRNEKTQEGEVRMWNVDEMWWERSE